MGGTLPDSYFKWDKKKSAENEGKLHTIELSHQEMLDLLFYIFASLTVVPAFLHGY